MQRKLENLKAIFFDLDNVLVFSEYMHFKAWQNVLNRYDVRLSESEFQNMIGVSDFLLAKENADRFSLKASPTELFEYKKENYLEIIKKGFDFPSGRNQFLEWVSKSCVIGLVSSSTQNAIHATLSIESIHHYFDFIIGFEDVDKHKPDPFPYQLALKKANVKAEEALVIEDSEAGITAANRASIPVVGILKDQAPQQIIKNIKYFNDFKEIHHWLS